MARRTKGSAMDARFWLIQVFNGLSYGDWTGA
jgi:hypothetical protein